MKKKVCAGLSALSFLAIAAVFLALTLYPHRETGEAAPRRIVTVWNVDTFEGGKGSRTAFLGRAARLAERSGDVYYYITAMSAEGARAALEGGDRPDILSFGLGLGPIAACGTPFSSVFSGGDTAEGCLALPWCGGGYYLFSRTDDFDETGEVAISSGGENLSAVAAALAGLTGTELPSQEAYVGFLGGKYRYLLGTQRDICRFAARGEAVFSRPLEDFCDLYQYISVLSREKERDCAAFLEALFSDEVQGALRDIGMRPAYDVKATYTVSVFLTAEGREELLGAARAGAEKIPPKFLKKV